MKKSKIRKVKKYKRRGYNDLSNFNSHICHRCGYCCSKKSGIRLVEILECDLKAWSKMGIYDEVVPHLSTTSECDSGFVIDFAENNGQCPFLVRVDSKYGCFLQIKYGYYSKPYYCRQFQPGSGCCRYKVDEI